MFPVHPSKVTTGYGVRGSLWSGGRHRGVDFAVPAGTPVFAPWSGTVVGIGDWGPAFGDRSPVIDFDRLPDGSAGLWGVLAHLGTVAVKVGQRVRAGDFIGTVGSRGNATGPHLHFEVQASRWWSRPEEKKDRAPAAWLAALPLEQGGRVYASRMLPGVDDSDSVRNLQAAIRQGGFAPRIPLTGFYGPLTRAGVEAAERALGLPVTGIGSEALVAGLPGGLVWVPEKVTAPEPAPEPVPVPVPGGSGVLVWSDYTGKPKVPQVVPADGRWHRVDLPALEKVPASGAEFHMLYARLNFTFKALGGMARAECKFVRGDGDSTAYEERHYERGTRSVPFQMVHFEKGEKGLAGVWWVRFSGGLKSVEITTRYAKTHVIAER